MSEQEQQHLDTSGVPSEAQRSGFNGERRDRVPSDELSPQAEANRRSLSRQVSRETLGRTEPEKSEATEEITPEQQMLYDIIDRSMAKTQKRPDGEDQEDPAPPQEEPEQEQQDAPPPPQKNKPSSFYVYLAVLFGAAFLMLLLAYFVQQRNNATAMDDLRMTSNASREELLEEIEALKKENESLTKENGRLNDWAKQKTDEAKELNDILDESYYQTNNLRIEKQALCYLWYLQQFMDQGDYTLAAAEIVFSTDPWLNAWENKIFLNPALLKQYDAARQDLIRRGYLQQLDHVRDGGTDIYFTSRWNPNENSDVAALSILWCALDAHFVQQSDNAASQYLFLYPLGNPATGYQERVERLASDFTLEQFRLMKDELVEDKWLVIAEDGVMSEGSFMGAKEDILYNLPFELPLETLTKIPVY